MSSVEIVPWSCRKEWELCRDNLFSEDIEMKKKAVDLLHLWKTRCPSLPAAVECTLLLMDTHLSQSEDRLRATTLELTYSMAVTKFVNFFTDSPTNRLTKTLPSAARELDIPQWIVDIRNAAAHRDLSLNLEELREAVEGCLKWLYDNYWVNDAFEECTDSDKKTNFVDIEQFVETYLIFRTNLFNGAEYLSQLSDEERVKVERYFKKTRDDDYNRSKNLKMSELSIKIMLKKLSSIIKKNASKGEYLIERLLKNDDMICAEALNSNGELEKRFIHNWADILSVLCASNLCFHLLESLMNITLNEMELASRRKCAAICLNELLKNINIWKTVPENDSSILPLITKRSKKSPTIQFDIRRPQLCDHEASALLKIALHEPNQFVSIYLKNLLEIHEPTLNKFKIKKLIELVDIYIGRIQFEIVDEIDDYSLKSIFGEAYEELMEVDKESCQSKEDAEFSAEVTFSNFITESSNCSGDYWCQTPLGILPWQNQSNIWLKMFK